MHPRYGAGQQPDTPRRGPRLTPAVSRRGARQTRTWPDGCTSPPPVRYWPGGSSLPAWVACCGH